ncbi:MAG: bifunctional riboflavin kinase/FAD synthetase [Candidatus Wallbacteria bacterium]
MKIIHGIENYKHPGSKIYAALGAFDGIHSGHVKLITEAIKAAKQNSGTSVIITFNPHPRALISGANSFKMITSPDEKAKILSSLGADILLILDFNVKLSEMLPEDFCGEVLVNKIGVTEVFIGFNFCFGKKRAGNAVILNEIGRSLGFKVNVIDGLEIGGFVVSSSKIRLLVESGAVEEAIKFLGRPYSMKGTVVHGDGLGGKLKIPTANIKSSCDEKIIPKNGVYAVKCSILGKFYDGLINIGTRPTVYEKCSNIVTCEVHLLDFNDDIYGHEVTVEFLKRIRDERRFADFNMLCDQIRQDIVETAEFFNSFNN